MAEKIDIKARLLESANRNREGGFGPGHLVDGGSIRRQPAGAPFDEADLSIWGIDTSEGEPKLVRVAISERHHSLVAAVAQRRRMTNRAVLERVVEKFFENGEFARLMETPD